MSRLVELERARQQALIAAFDLGYATRFIKRILLSDNPVQITQIMNEARNTSEYQSEETVRTQLALDGLRVPSLRGTCGQNFID